MHSVAQNLLRLTKGHLTDPEKKTLHYWLKRGTLPFKKYIYIYCFSCFSQECVRVCLARLRRHWLTKVKINEKTIKRKLLNMGGPSVYIYIYININSIRYEKYMYITLQRYNEAYTRLLPFWNTCRHWEHFIGIDFRKRWQLLYNKKYQGGPLQTNKQKIWKNWWICLVWIIAPNHGDKIQSTHLISSTKGMHPLCELNLGLRDGHLGCLCNHRECHLGSIGWRQKIFDGQAKAI